MGNLSLLFYKNYYNGFNKNWKNIKSDHKKTKEDIALFFNKKNKKFLGFILGENGKSDKSGFEMTTTYPGLLFGSGYTKGIGAIGEFKLGFQLDHVTGLPIIPGSSIKGAIRSAFPDIQCNTDNNKVTYAFKGKDDSKEKIINEVKTKWIINLLNEIESPDFLSKEIEPVKTLSDGDIEKVFNLKQEIFEGVADYNSEKNKDKYLSIYKRDIFYDASPVRSKDGKLFETDSITPHVKEGLSHEESMLRNPIPLLFLKVKPQVCYHFHIETKTNSSLINKDKKMLLFKRILFDLGIGAKTNVGYGQFERPEFVDSNNMERPLVNELDEIDDDVNVPSPPAPTEIKPAYNTQKLNYKKRYDMDAIVIKSRKPNIVKVFVSKDYCPEIRLDRQPNPIEVGRIIIVDVSISKKGNVTQANYKSDKK